MSEVERQTVLIIEDEQDVAETYAEFLQDDYSVRIANNGLEGLSKLDDTVDVVVLDRRMPGMSGGEVLTEIRESDVTCRVVMATAVNPDVDLLNMEFDEYLVKPITRASLRNAVERMFARKTLENRLQEMVRMSTKLATLEMKLDVEQLEESDEYHELLNEFETIRSEVDFPDEKAEYYSVAMRDKLKALLD